MYTSSKNMIIKIHEGAPGFAISDSIVTYPRASVEFSADCPAEYIQLIQRARIKGWLKSVAYITEEEYTWNQLKTP
jgi:hypothetical protein